MKKIGIFGSYNYQSIGDTGILEGILLNLFENNKNLFIKIYVTDTKNLSKYFENFEFKKIFFLDANPIKKQITKISEKDRKSKLNNVLLIIQRKVLGLILYRNKIVNFLLKIFYDFIIIFKFSKFWKNLKKEFKELDLLVIGGGNILMDLYYKWPVYLKIYSYLAKVNNVPIFIYSVGAGPINTTRGKKYIRQCCLSAKYITTRDKESKLVLEKIGVKKNIRITSDPAILLNYNKRKKQKIIGISFVPYYDSRYWPESNDLIYSKYIFKMANIINNLLKEYDYKFVFFNTNFPSDYKTALDIYKKVIFKDRINIIDSQLRAKEIISIISSFEFIISSRLHSIIFSTISETPFIAISYQDKVVNFCKSINLQELVIALDKEINLNYSEIRKIILYLIANKEKIKSRLNIANDKFKKLQIVNKNIISEVLN